MPKRLLKLAEFLFLVFLLVIPLFYPFVSIQAQSEEDISNAIAAIDAFIAEATSISTNTDPDSAAGGSTQTSSSVENAEAASTGQTDAAFDNADSDFGESSTFIPPPSTPIISSQACTSGGNVNLSWNPTSTTTYYNVFRSDSPIPSFNGLLGTYYDAKELAVPLFTQIDPPGADPNSAINFDWGQKGPTQESNPAKNFIDPDRFSAKWTGKIKPIYSGNHTFQVDVRGGVSFYIDEKKVMKHWNAGDNGSLNTYGSGIFDLDKNKTYNIRLEYNNNKGPAGIKLSWIRPEGDNLAPTKLEIIPKLQMTPSFSNNVNPKLIKSGIPRPGNKIIYDDTGAGEGLYAEYYRNRNFADRPALFRIDPKIEFADSYPSIWLNNPNNGPSFDPSGPTFNLPDGVSGMWRGKIMTTSQGNYTFTVRTKGGARLYITDLVSGKLFDSWPNAASVRDLNATINLEANQAYDFRLEWNYDGTGDNSLQLLWTLPNGTQQVIPQEQFYHQINTYFTPGLFSQFYDSKFLTGGPFKTENGGAIDYPTSNSLPPNPAYAAATVPYSARFSGMIKTTAKGDYTFKVDSPGDIRVILDTKTALRKLEGEGTGVKTSDPIPLEANQYYLFSVEYKQGTGTPKIILKWNPAGQGEQDILASNLVHHINTLASELTPGILVRYYDNLKNSGHTYSQISQGRNNPDTPQIETDLDFPYPSSSPPLYLNSDTFSLRFNGKLKTTPAQGYYQFYSLHNDGVKVYVDKNKVIDQYNKLDSDALRSGTGLKRLDGNTTYDFRSDFFNDSGGGQVDFDWKPPSGSQESIPLANMYIGQVTSTPKASFTDTSVSPNTYLYQVQAVGSGGYTNSEWVGVQVGDCGQPAAPTLTYSCQPLQVNVSWKSVGGASGYNVYRKDGIGGSLNLLNTSGPLPSTQLQYPDSTAPSNTQLFYAITSITGTTESAFSSETSITPDCSTPQAYLSLTSNGVTTTQWDPPLHIKQNDPVSISWWTINNPDACTSSTPPANPSPINVWSGGQSKSPGGGTDVLSPIPVIGRYQFDLACTKGGSSYPPSSIILEVDQLKRPYIQTTGGDVHTNEAIYIPQ